MSIDPRLEAAYARGVAIRAKLRKAEGGSISLTQAASRLKISTSTLRRWYRIGKIIGWKEGRSALRFPTWQFKRSKILPGLVEVIAALNSGCERVNDYSCMLFFLSSMRMFNGRRPLDLLREGNVADVKRIASCLWL